MKESKAESVLLLYESFEEQIIEFLKYVPAQDENFNTWSPRLATILVDACGLMESLMKYPLPQKVRVNNKIKDKQDLKINDIAEIYNSLSNKKVILLKSPPEYSQPFSEWLNKDCGQYKSPWWWRIHNEIKHEKIDFLNKATLKVTIEALSGLITTIAHFPDMTKALIRYRWFNTRGWNPEAILEKSNSNGFSQNDYFTVETKLFVALIGAIPPENIQDLTPSLYGSSRLVSFFGRI